MNFSEALEALKKGELIQRKGWNGKGMYLVYYSPVAHSTDFFRVNNSVLPLKPFIMMKTTDDMWVPWLASQTDILADDWQIFNN